VLKCSVGLLTILPAIGFGLLGNISISCLLLFSPTITALLNHCFTQLLTHSLTHSLEREERIEVQREEMSKGCYDDDELELDLDNDHSDMDESESKRHVRGEEHEEKVCWLGDEEEMKMEINQSEEVGDENRPLFNPASLVRKSFAYKSLSYVPYPKEKDGGTDMIFWTLQVKPKTMNGDLVQMFYW
jgi:hypothetical protein